MAICLNCGKEIKTIGRTCPYCNTPIKPGSIMRKEDIKMPKVSNETLIIISIVLPVIGLIVYYLKKDTEEVYARKILTATLIGIIFYLALISIIVMLKLF